jgi:hypothetical protein
MERYAIRGSKCASWWQRPTVCDILCHTRVIGIADPVALSRGTKTCCSSSMSWRPLGCGLAGASSHTRLNACRANLDRYATIRSYFRQSQLRKLSVVNSVSVPNNALGRVGLARLDIFVKRIHTNSTDGMLRDHKKRFVSELKGHNEAQVCCNI